MAAKRTKSESFGPAIYILGTAAAVLLSWYAYQVFVHFTEEEPPRAERKAKPGSALLIMAMDEKFDAEDVIKCEMMESEYLALNGEPLEDADVRRLLNLPDDAVSQTVRRRCVDFAKAVAEMNKLSRHTLHVMVCQGSFFRVGNDDRYTIRPDPKGRGVIQTVTQTLPKNLSVTKGRSAIVDEWQVHNMGDGCVIVGDSAAKEAKSQTRRKGVFIAGAFK